MTPETRRVLHSSKNEHWNTPAVILDPLRAHFGPIDLDPASNATSIVQAKVAYHGPEVDVDGLVPSWRCGGIVFLNPPYGRKIVPWVKKMAEEAAVSQACSDGTEYFLLGPARTDTKWFQRHVLPSADSVLMWEGRLKFGGAKDAAPFPSFLAYWGHRPDVFALAYAGKGFFID